MTIASDSTRNRFNAIGAVVAELYRQDDLCGIPESQEQTAERRLAILAEEFGEYAKEVCDRNALKARDELVQVAAVAIANIQRIDQGLDGVREQGLRERPDPSPRFEPRSSNETYRPC